MQDDGTTYVCNAAVRSDAPQRLCLGSSLNKLSCRSTGARCRNTEFNVIDPQSF